MLTPQLRAHGNAALSACRDVLRSVAESDLGRSTPCSEYTIADLGNHLERSMILLAGSADTQLAPATGRTLEERVVPLAEAALSAWELRGVQGSVSLGSRTLPAEQVYDIVLLELVIHGWDLHRALGEPLGAFRPRAELVDHLRAIAPLLITPDRRGKAFAGAVPVPADAPPLDALVAFSGRRP